MGGFIVAIIGTIATVVGVWLQFESPRSRPSETTTTTTATTDTFELPVSATTTEPPEIETTPTSTTPTPEVELPETGEPLFTTSTLQEVFGFPQNGNCLDVNYGYTENDVAVRHCTFSSSPVYLFLHKYSGVDSADYLAQFPSSLEYRSDLEGPDGLTCADKYLNTFTGTDGIAYNSKIVHFLHEPFLVEIIAPAALYSRADIEQVTVQVNSDLAC